MTQVIKPIETPKPEDIMSEDYESPLKLGKLDSDQSLCLAAD